MEKLRRRKCEYCEIMSDCSRARNPLVDMLSGGGGNSKRLFAKGFAECFEGEKWKNESGFFRHTERKRSIQPIFKSWSKCNKLDPSVVILPQDDEKTTFFRCAKRKGGEL